jgi:hypothetical protein
VGEHGHGAALAGEESVRQALHQVVFDDLSRSAELLGSADLLEELRARGRARQEPGDVADDAELARAVEDLLTSIYEGVPLIISRLEYAPDDRDLAAS